MKLVGEQVGCTMGRKGRRTDRHSGGRVLSGRADGRAAGGLYLVISITYNGSRWFGLEYKLLVGFPTSFPDTERVKAKLASLWDDFYVCVSMGKRGSTEGEVLGEAELSYYNLVL